MFQQFGCSVCTHHNTTKLVSSICAAQSTHFTCTAKLLETNLEGSVHTVQSTVFQKFNFQKNNPISQWSSRGVKLSFGVKIKV